MLRRVRLITDCRSGILSPARNEKQIFGRLTDFKRLKKLVFRSTRRRISNAQRLADLEDFINRRWVDKGRKQQCLRNIENRSQNKNRDKILTLKIQHNFSLIWRLLNSVLLLFCIFPRFPVQRASHFFTSLLLSRTFPSASQQGRTTSGSQAPISHSTFSCGLFLSLFAFFQYHLSPRYISPLSHL